MTTVANLHKSRWLTAVRATPGLSRGNLRVAEWLAGELQPGETVVHRNWSQMKKELDLPQHAAGVHLTNLGRKGLVGERIRTGPSHLQGFPLDIPLPKVAGEKAVSSYETRAEVEARNARRAAARRRADLEADAKWLAK
jgi:hypothetical protein